MKKLILGFRQKTKNSLNKTLTQSPKKHLNMLKNILLISNTAKIRTAKPCLY